MKKLAYIILVIAILLVIAHFVKNDQTTAQEPVVQTQAVVEETAAEVPAAAEAAVTATVVEENAVATQAPTEAVSTEATAATQPEQAVSAEDNDVVEVQETSEDIIVGDDAAEDDGAIDVEETSAATMDEEETVLPE